MASRLIPFDLILARTLSGGIGKNGGLPWRLPREMKMFKKITTFGANGNAVIMGRKTFQSIGRRPLPNRLNIVVSSQERLVESEHLSQASNLTEALQLAGHRLPAGNVFVVGGSRLFEEGLVSCRYVYESLLAQDIPCDVFAPKHNFPCHFVSKTFHENGIRYDHRLYANPSQHSLAAPLPFGVPEHEQYQYLRTVGRIINEGQEKIDRTKTGTKSLFGGLMRYDLSESFPLLTYKKVFFRGVAEELLWFIKGSTDASELQRKNVRIWDGNSSKEYLQSRGLQREEGDLGPVYGFQWRHWNAQYTTKDKDYRGQGIDQLAALIEEIKINPESRRLILTAWNPSQLSEMALPPCHLLCQFQVSKGRLNCMMFQRSCDMGLGVPFNIASYALLTCMIAHVTGLKRGELVHALGDMHVYNDHIPSLAGIQQTVPHAFPELKLAPTVTKIDDFRMEHIELVDYRSGGKIDMKMSV